MKGFRVWGLGFSLIIFVLLYPIPYTLGAILASENDIGYSSLDPSNPFYFIKGIREEIELKLALTPYVKHVRHLEFATRRLREARNLVDKNPSLIPASLERYTSNLNTLLDRRTISGELALKIESSLTSHLLVLQKMHEDLKDNNAKRSIRSAVDKILRRPDIEKPARLKACEFLEKEASSSALNQAEQIVTKERAQKCSGL